MKVSLLACALLVFQPTAMAGELECFLGCRLDGFRPNIKWKPTNCFKPSAPMMFVSDARSYNFAIDQFNSYLAQMKSYMSCISNEATTDVKKLPDIILEGAQAANQEAADEVARERSRLQMMRPMR